MSNRDEFDPAFDRHPLDNRPIDAYERRQFKTMVAHIASGGLELGAQGIRDTVAIMQRYDPVLASKYEAVGRILQDITDYVKSRTEKMSRSGSYGKRSGQ